MPNSRNSISFNLSVRATRSILVSVIALSCAYLFFCVRSFRADRLAHSGTLADLISATRLESDNAADWQRLGVVRLYEGNDPEGALRAFQRAVQLNSRDADSWIGAAYAFQFLGKPEEERLALSHALDAEPRRPEIAWQAANLYAGLGDREAMMQQVCVVLHHDRIRKEAALYLARRIAGSQAVDCDELGIPH